MIERRVKKGYPMLKKRAPNPSVKDSGPYELSG